MVKLRKMRLDVWIDLGIFGKLAPVVCAGQSVHGFDGLNGARSRAGGKDEVMPPKTLVVALPTSNQEPTSSVTDWLIEIQSLFAHHWIFKHEKYEISEIHEK